MKRFTIAILQGIQKNGPGETVATLLKRNFMGKLDHHLRSLEFFMSRQITLETEETEHSFEKNYTSFSLLIC